MIGCNSKHCLLRDPDDRPAMNTQCTCLRSLDREGIEYVKKKLLRLRMIEKEILSMKERYNNG